MTGRTYDRDGFDTANPFEDYDFGRHSYAPFGYEGSEDDFDEEVEKEWTKDDDDDRSWEAQYLDARDSRTA